MRITINRKLDIPIYIQIKNEIRDKIFSGELVEGLVLPPERKLAEELAVSRTTVIKAYDELKADGLIGSHIGKGTCVLPQLFSKQSANRTQVNPIPWHQYYNSGIISVTNHIVSDIIDYAGQKDIISLAAGLPSPDMYPTQELEKIQYELMNRCPTDLYNCCAVEGYYPLRESIAGLMRTREIAASPREVMILSGSQQGLDFLSKIFLSPGDVVIVEEPSYLGALQLFNFYGARVIGIPIDEQGMRTDLLETVLLRHKPKFIYTLPTFQNPSGAVMSLERRYKLLELAYSYQIPIIEDDPYGEIRFEGRFIPSIKSLDKHGYVIYLSTASKVTSLGLRLGWVTASTAVISKLSIAKQLSDLHSNTFMQYMFDAFIRGGYFEEQVRKVCNEYKLKRNVMLDVLEEFKAEGVLWNVPEGGYYVWCKIPQAISQSKLLACSVKNGVVYVPGEAFYPSGAKLDKYIRLNFTLPTCEDIKKGVARLMKSIDEVSEKSNSDYINAECSTNPIV